MSEEVLFDNVLEIAVNEKLAQDIARICKELIDALVNSLKIFDDEEKQFIIGYAILKTSLTLWEYIILDVLEKTKGDVLVFYHNKCLMDIFSNKLLIDFHLNKLPNT